MPGTAGRGVPLASRVLLRNFLHPVRSARQRAASSVLFLVQNLQAGAPWWAAGTPHSTRGSAGPGLAVLRVALAPLGPQRRGTLGLGQGSRERG